VPIWVTDYVAGSSYLPIKHRDKVTIVRGDASDTRPEHPADGTDMEILNWLDDHSRYLLYCTASTSVSGKLGTRH
jgi:hypothetical protein